MRTKQRGVIQALSISVFNFCSAARKLVAFAAQAGAGEEAARDARLSPRGNAPVFPRFVFVAVADECPRHDARPPCLRACCPVAAFYGGELVLGVMLTLPVQQAALSTFYR